MRRAIVEPAPFADATYDRIVQLRLIGAGLPRTGTSSMKSAIEQLTGGRCYHMFETGADGHVDLWRRALDGEFSALEQVLDGFAASVDWPASAFWRELALACPDAPVVLSTRQTPEEWWASADRTVWSAMRERRDGDRDEWTDMSLRLMDRFTPDWSDQGPSIARYREHCDEVRSVIAPERLIECTPESGWAPLCEALGVDVPADDYPRLNTTDSFRQHLGWD